VNKIDNRCHFYFFYVIDKQEKKARLFVTGKPGPIFGGKALGTCPREPASLSNIRLEGKGLSETNTLAYLAFSLETKKNCLKLCLLVSLSQNFFSVVLKLQQNKLGRLFLASTFITVSLIFEGKEPT